MYIINQCIEEATVSADFSPVEWILMVGSHIFLKYVFSCGEKHCPPPNYWVIGPQHRFHNHNHKRRPLKLIYIYALFFCVAVRKTLGWCRSCVYKQSSTLAIKIDLYLCTLGALGQSTDFIVKQPNTVAIKIDLYLCTLLLCCRKRNSGLMQKLHVKIWSVSSI